MFRCQLCDTVVPKGIRTNRLVVRTRTKLYAPRGAKPKHGRPWQGKSRSKRRSAYDKGGEGTEIVQELAVCPQCAEKHETAEQA